MGVRDVLESSWRPFLSAVLAGVGLFAYKQWVWQAGLPLLALLTDLGIYSLFYLLSWLLVPGGLPTIREGVRLSIDLFEGMRASRASN